ncbi:hypothetical protein D6C78_01663 [Aureobasidium pullulans]|uniref:Zn(2)-C6 fungal-type domain-containing protein n=1 Tax=Aureobasidium pullulans TaxID=5580 RepID=A0A4V6TL07_AURPU|nr:hypothetical protein D6C93_02240 [Aureobasidium pullulans]TIA41607.1 hypothetical protein D6C78_01663 [Aureobasidium pullulans]
MEHERSPEGDLGPDRKRRRKVLSCMDCRRRKVQCDRSVPVCGRCEKAGKPCSYEDDSPSQQASTGSGLPYVSRQQSVTVSRDVWDDMFNRLLHQERVIERLQATHASPATPATVSIATPQVHGNLDTPGGTSDIGAKERMLFRGKGFKTTYFGPSDARSAMTLNAHNFFREEVSRNPELVRCRRDVAKLRAVKKILDKQEVSSLQESLVSYLPERIKVDLLVRMYFENIDCTWGILHAPSFQREYEIMWQDPLNTKPGFVAVVLLMMACCQCLVREQPQTYRADSPLPRETAISLIHACETWIAQSSRKHTDLQWYQVQCLLLVAKQTHQMKMKRRWVESGNLLRVAISAGLHRDPELLQKKTLSSAFEHEMRRRIWAFIVEWDLQTSVDRGMPPISSDIASDCGPPSNLHDTEFDESTIIMPPSRPLTESTKMTYTCLSSRNRGLRRKIIAVINQPLHQVSYDEVLAYTQELELNLASLPDWAGDRLRDLTAHDQSVALLHIQLEQFLLILHGHAARQAVTKTHITFSKQAFKSAAVSILDKLSELSAKGFKFLLMVRADIQRVFTSTLALGNTEDKDISTQDLRNLVQPSLELADKALDLFEEKILTTGGIQWTHTFLVYDMLLCKVHPLGRNMPSRPGSGRIYSICKKIMDNQDSDFSAKVVPLKDSVPTPKKNKGQRATKMHVTTEDNTTQQPPPSLNSDVVPNLSFSDMLDWNFDDWMLYTDMFWSPQNMSLPSLSEQNLQY